MARPAQAHPAARLAAPPFGRSRSSRRRDPASGAAKPASPPVRVTIVAAKGVKEDAAALHWPAFYRTSRPALADWPPVLTDRTLT